MKTPPARSAKPATISDLSHGKTLEKDLSGIMNLLEDSHPIHWERVVDSAYANSLIRAADCDFKLTVYSGTPGQPFVFWIECKASVQPLPFTKLFRSLIKKDQLPLMRKGERGGVCGLYMFRSVPTQRIEIWSLQDIAAWYYQKRTEMLSEPKFSFPNHRLAEWCEQLCTRPDYMRGKILS